MVKLWHLSCLLLSVTPPRNLSPQDHTDNIVVSSSIDTRHTLVSPVSSSSSLSPTRHHLALLKTTRPPPRSILARSTNRLQNLDITTAESARKLTWSTTVLLDILWQGPEIVFNGKCHLISPGLHNNTTVRPCLCFFAGQCPLNWELSFTYCIQFGCEGHLFSRRLGHSCRDVRCWRRRFEIRHVGPFAKHAAEEIGTQIFSDLTWHCFT